MRSRSHRAASYSAQAGAEALNVTHGARRRFAEALALRPGRVTIEDGVMERPRESRQDAGIVRGQAAKLERQRQNP